MYLLIKGFNCDKQYLLANDCNKLDACAITIVQGVLRPSTQWARVVDRLTLTRALGTARQVQMITNMATWSGTVLVDVKESSLFISVSKMRSQLFCAKRPSGNNW